jgi:8-oxo-dGTP diphosphatase
MKRSYPDRPIAAVGAIVVKDGHVLLIRRGKAPSYGIWSVPGGAVHLGESLRDAVRREIREECGIEIDLTDVLEAVDRITRDAEGRTQYHYVVIDYLARWASGEVASASDSLEARWVAPADLSQYQMTSGTADVIRKMLAAGKREGVL